MPILQENVSLQSFNTFGIDVNANYFAEVKSEADLKEVFDHPIAKTQNLLVLGGGSNMLFTKNFEGLVVKVSIPGISYQIQGDEVSVVAGGGVVWNDLVNYCVAQGFAGIENLSLIPGTVGASPIQNIGAYGVELKDVFTSCMAFEIATGKIKTFDHADCKFGYRDSVFKNELKGLYIITSVQFHLSKQAKLQTHYGAITTELANRHITEPTIADVSAVVAAIRVSKLPDPKTIGNAGSFFKNPVISVEEFERLVQKFPDVVHYPAPNGKVKLAAGWFDRTMWF
ncbi:UDP-N-acetylmuramate dehydrogenase [Pedobacter sp. UC225_65]|uniref:UDP-N-acetylmuramate dehydrogenase n=1 Tax=Pedobacter sp. UC225_65 TaxID=3350173 RepID=UPI00367042E0